MQLVRCSSMHHCLQEGASQPAVVVQNPAAPQSSSTVSPAEDVWGGSTSQEQVGGLLPNITPSDVVTEPNMPPRNNPSPAPSVASSQSNAIQHRWYALRQTARLLHVILEMKEEFLLRDVGHRSRLEKDGAARNSFWVRACEKFNDKTFLPSGELVIERVPDLQSKIALEAIDPSDTKYTGAAVLQL